MEIRIFLTNLGKYNEGELVGNWFTLPIDLDEALKEIGIGEENADGSVYEEFFITDYEAPFKIGEYDDIEHLNSIAEELDKTWLEDDDINLLMQYYSDFEEMLSDYNQGRITIYSGYTAEQYAEEYVEETGLLNEVPDSLKYYIDYEALGRDMRLEGSIAELADGVLVIC